MLVLCPRVRWCARWCACCRYEQFDDFLELVVQQGYITLFASAFPLCAALSFFCNLIEIRSDIFKLAFVTRRPPATRAANIGTWQSLITVQVRVCAWQRWNSSVQLAWRCAGVCTHLGGCSRGTRCSSCFRVA